MYARVFGIGRWKVLVSQPHEWAFGHVGLDILHTLHAARAIGARAYFLPPSRMVNRALYEIESPIVPVVRQNSLWVPLLRLSWRLQLLAEDTAEAVRTFAFVSQKSFLKWLKRCRKRFERQMLLAAQRYMEANDFPKHVRVEVKERIEALRRREAGPELEGTQEDVKLSLYQRSTIRHPLEVRFSAENARRAETMARAAGIESTERLVTVHIRESGFKHMGGHEEAPFDVARNGSFENYDTAFALLREQGYAIVRIGDPMMTPLQRDGIVDLATSPHRNDLLELWLLYRSAFHLGCDSGPGAVCLLLNTPTVLVNTTNPINTYPVRAGSIYILKHVIDRETGRELSLEDLLTEEYLAHWRTTRRYRYVDNSSEEIRSAVAEMLENLARPPVESEAQRRYHEGVYRAIQELKGRVSYIRKWGTDDEFLGDGRIARFYADRHWRGSGVPAAVAAGGVR